ncbi:MAG: T9SS type A sorting domain-containing protein [Ferruginibacter sp.]
MKYFFTAILLLGVCFASAQIVNFPNADVKNEILNYPIVVDTNGDGEIQISEAEAVHSLGLQHGITDDLAWLQYFSNIDTLGLYSWPPLLTTLNLSGNTKLRRLSCDSKSLQTVNLSGCTNLIHLDINPYTPAPYSLISVFDISNTPNLRDLLANGLGVAELDLSQNDSLVNFSSYWLTNVGVVNVSGLPILQRLHFSGHEGLINAEGATALEDIFIGGGASTDAQTVDSINVHGCINLDEINIGKQYTASAIDVSTCTKLRLLTGSSNTIRSLDFSNCYNFVHVYGNFPNLHYLNLKNGNHDRDLYLTPITNPTQPLYVCTDDFEMTYVDSFLYARGWDMNNVVMNPFCSIFANGGAFNTISGTVRLDRDQNGCDNTDSVMPYVPVKFINGFGNSTVRYTNYYSGEYHYYDTTGNFTVKPYFPYAYFTISPVTANVVFNTVNNLTDVNDFCIKPNGVHNQLDITVVPTSPVIMGRNTTFRIIYRNRGTTTLSGNVELNYDNTKFTYHSASATPVQSVGQLSWNYSNLLPLETKWINVDLHTTGSPFNHLGDTLLLLATINPVAGDESPANNSFILPQLVTGSYDPNNKLCLQGEKLDITKIGDELDYVINFQNLGTAPAFNVVVTDTLSNNLDWESFDITGTSHPCDIQRKDNKLQFYFKDINLPEAAVDEPASHGFIAFKIRPKSTVVIGDSLNNRASIYFDFNAAVVTNMATTIVSPTSTVAVKLEYFSLTTKNETNLLTWKAPSTSGTTNFGIERSNDGIHFINFGNITASVDRCQLPFNFTDENPFDGKTYYRLNIKDADGNSFYSKVLVVGRTKSGLSINAVVSDRNNTTIYFNASKAQNIQMKIIAADGRLMYNQNKTIEAGNSTLNLPLKNLATGIYTLIIYTTEGEVITRRFVK